MAATITETHFIRLGGFAPGLCLLVGTFVTAGGTSAGVVTPGSNDTNVTGSGSMENMLFWGFTNVTDENAIEVVRTKPAGGDILTIDCTADESFDFFIVGFDNGEA